MFLFTLISFVRTIFALTDIYYLIIAFIYVRQLYIQYEKRLDTSNLVYSEWKQLVITKNIFRLVSKIILLFAYKELILIFVLVIVRNCNSLKFSQENLEPILFKTWIKVLYQQSLRSEKDQLQDIFTGTLKENIIITFTHIHFQQLKQI